MKKSELLTEIEDLSWALKDANGFAEWVLSVSKPDIEMYKHEFEGAAILAIDRINLALSKSKNVTI